MANPMTKEEVGRQHQGMDRTGVRQVPEGSGEQGKMEKTGCEIICGAPTTLTVKGLIKMMMSLFHFFIHVGQAAMKHSHFLLHYWLSKYAAFPPQISLFLTVWWTKDSLVNCLGNGGDGLIKRITWPAVSLLSTTHLTSNITSLTVSNDKLGFTRTNLAWQEYKTKQIWQEKNYGHSRTVGSSALLVWFMCQNKSCTYCAYIFFFLNILFSNIFFWSIQIPPPTHPPP